MDSLIYQWQEIKKDTDAREKAKLLNRIGDELRFSNADSAIYYYNKALKIARESDLPNMVATSYRGIGYVKYVEGEYDYAMENFMEAIDIWEKNDNQWGIAIGLNNIGLIQNMQEHYRPSIRNHQKSLEIAKQIADTNLLSHNHFNMGISYYSLKKYDSALLHAQKALEFKNEAGKPNEGLRMLNLMGNVYADMGKYEKAIQALTKVINTDDYDNKWEISYAMAGLAKVYKQTGDLEKSIDIGVRSYELAKEVNAKWDKQNVTKILAEAYAKKGDYKKAYQYHKLHKKYSDSIFNEKRDNKINYLRLKRKESKNKALARENRLQEVRIKRRNQQLIAGAAGIVGLIVLTSLLYRHNRLKTSYNKNLQQKNEEIADKNEKLTDLNVAKDTLFRVIAHDLKTPISVVVSYTDLIKEDFDEYDKEELLDIIQKLNYSSNEALRLLHNLMEWARSQSGSIAFDPKPINITEVIQESEKLLQTNLEGKNVNLISKVDSDIFVYADYNLTSTVVRNLLSNAIKYTPKGGEIVIEINEENGNYVISVTDTGMGISEEDQMKLFKVNETNKRKGTNNERGTGLGLIICKEFVEKQNGEIWVESEVGKGSRFTFTLPAYQQQG
ncbi:MAG: tetratricopeptide repeat-containing sensor histidine kinase [Bacteroidales bacterium]|nr:tetratricopeptide repeat-containing sensor histidine kinase [Bacteroidales bacterium]MCF8333235.1 tetratricopeptide repeat-containing sensor histidine kinase [Bacteroidales bacterium]